jgi:hypothetical protein
VDLYTAEKLVAGRQAGLLAEAEEAALDAVWARESEETSEWWVTATTTRWKLGPNTQTARLGAVSTFSDSMKARSRKSPNTMRRRSHLPRCSRRRRWIENASS